MALSKKGGESPNQRRQSRQNRLWPVALVLVVLAVIAAAVIWALITPQKAAPLTSSDANSVQQDKQENEEAESKPPVETSLVVSEPSDATDPPSSKQPASSKEPAPSKESTSSTKPVSSRESVSSKEPVSSMKPAKPESTPSSLDRAAQTLLESMSLEEKIYQLFVVTPEQLYDVSGTVTQAGSATGAALHRHPVGGVVCFAGNIQTPNQITQMISGLQSSSRLGLFIAVDEEGGRVARLGNNSAMGTTAFPPMGEIGALGDIKNARNVGLTIGKEIKQFGFNLDFAPVADVNSNPNNPVIANRAFSSDPQIAAKMVAACVAGFKESGMLCTLKHFPGHGDTATDSHYGAASSNKTLEELSACEFLPFQSGIAAGANMVMVGHISLPNVTGNDMPASLSYEITTGILRKQLQFNGLIVTDSMSMKAITSRFSSGDAAVQALKAGADMILMPASLDSAVNGILNAMKNGTLHEKRLNESVYRILYTKLSQGIIPLSLVGQ